MSLKVSARRWSNDLGEERWQPTIVGDYTEFMWEAKNLRDHHFFIYWGDSNPTGGDTEAKPRLERTRAQAVKAAHREIKRRETAAAAIIQKQRSEFWPDK